MCNTICHAWLIDLKSTRKAPDVKTCTQTKKTPQMPLPSPWRAIVVALAALAFSVQAQTPASCPPCPARDGFHIVGSQIFDPHGQPFIARGVNRVHWDSWGTAADAKRMGANTVRMSLDFRRPAAANLAIAQSYVDAGIVPIPGNWIGTCKSDAATLTAIVDTWVAQAPVWTALNRTGMINISNEWGQANSLAWRDAYVVAVQRMRAAGYTGVLVVDSGSCGQDSLDIVRYGPAVLAADSLHNILFDVHVYGMWHRPATATWMQDYDKAMTALKASGLAIILGEFGPGRNIGPSPTLVTPMQVVADAQRNGFSWLAWSADDIDLPGCMASDHWYSMTVKCGVYTGQDAELTTYGRQVVSLLKALNAPSIKQ